MKQYLFKVMGLLACIGLISGQVQSQQKEKLDQNEEIIIKKKGDKDTKITVEIDGDDVRINGKPLTEFNDENVIIRKRRSIDGMTYTLPSPASPFRGGTWNFDDGGVAGRVFENSRKAFLGVMSEKAENGAKIKTITKGGAAEKAGLKEGDIITRVNDEKIEGPEDLTEAIGKLKADDKATITYKRDKKEQKVSATLGRRSEAYARSNFGFDNGNFELFRQDHDNFFPSTAPRLGIKAQDTDDGKGVKVLEVDDESNAQKAGIKEGDIVTEFDGKEVNSATELANAARAARDKSTIKLKLNREGKSQQIEIKVPRKLKTANL